MLTVYAYDKCQTCRSALKWLEARRIPYQVRAIREQPPSLPELRRMLVKVGDKRALFNTSGQDYRAQGIKDKLPTLGDDDALKLLAANGNLIKRPFVIGPRAALVGFDADAWKAALG